MKPGPDVLAGGGQKFGSFTRASFLAVKAMAQREQNRWAEAHRSLARRDVMAQIAEPGPGEPQPTWFSCVQAQLLLREAESRIAKAPVADEAAGTPLPAPPSRGAQASCRPGVGPGGPRRDPARSWPAGESRGRARGRARRAGQIAAEEPANPDYEADVAATSQKLGQWLFGTQKLDLAIPRIQHAAALLEKLGDMPPQVTRIRKDLASTELDLAEAARRANRPADAALALKYTVDFLTRTTADAAKSSSADWLMLTVAHGWQGGRDQAAQAFAKAVELLKPAKENQVLRPLVRKAVLAVGLDCPGASELLAAVAGEPPAALAAAIRQQPAAAREFQNRAEWYAPRIVEEGRR